MTEKSININTKVLDDTLKYMDEFNTFLDSENKRLDKIIHQMHVFSIVFSSIISLFYTYMIFISWYEWNFYFNCVSFGVCVGMLFDEVFWS